jgi:hypothetical protein
MDKCVRVIQDGQPLQQIEKNNKEDKMSYRVTALHWRVAMVRSAIHPSHPSDGQMLAK